MENRVYIIQPSYKTMDGKLIKRLPVFNFSNNLPIISATIPLNWEKRICIEYFDEIDYNDPASVVILTSTGYDIVHAFEVAKKFHDKGKFVVIGVLMENISRVVLLDVVDSFFTGYPNPQSMKDMLNDITNGSLKPEYDLGMNLDFPFDYTVFENHKMWFYPAMTSAGCKYSCSYCCYPQFYHSKYRVRNIEFVVSDLKVIKKKNKFIGFLDANLFNEREYLKKLLQRMIDEKLHLYWAAQSTIEIGDDTEILELLKQAGCKILFFGIETLDKTNLKQLNKFSNEKRYSQQLKNIKMAGILLGAFFMFGLDNDTPESFDKVHEFIIENKIDIPYIHLLIPLPGTGVYNKIEKEGRIYNRFYEEFQKLNPKYSIPCSKLFFSPARMKDHEVEEAYLKLHKKISSWPAILFRTLRCNPIFLPLILYLNYEGKRKLRAMKINYNEIKNI